MTDEEQHRSGATVVEQHPRGRRGVRRGRGPLLVGVAIVVVAAVSAVGALGLGGDDEVSEGSPGRGSKTVQVTRSTLIDQTEIDGRLGHGPEVPFPIKAQGTVTWLPERGTKVGRGQPVLRVNDRPVTLLYGSMPMYRDLAVPSAAAPADDGRGGDDSRGATGASAGGTSAAAGSGSTGGSGSASSGTEGASASAGTGSGGNSGSGGGGTSDTTGSGGQAGGASAESVTATGAGRPATAPRERTTPLRGMDVKQFETNLSALGYSGFTVDESYSELTAQAVKRWQKDLGIPQTGRVSAGDIVYGPGPIRIAATSVRVGGSAAGDPVSYTSTSRMVSVNAPAADTEWAQRGSSVTVELPDGRSVKAKVASVGNDASAPTEGSGSGEGSDGGTGAAGSGPATVSVVITFSDQKALGRLESGPVTVRYVVKERKGVLTVPVAALVALAEGGHALELAADGTGSDRFIPVRTGLFAGGKVEVTSPALSEGAKVRIPQ
ncbi:peptidoglycan-binding protein [Streptomyces albipurpureus]|uniref:Peptidoglycan-binding protein n=1 Tax=Streptomyces albipurpureus TaxID=2897419 RepID=A0ABT0V1S2_9ACTN|nr:peptidoglycan-binding protein [Streptomyces sp. CWNU-1]MCM2393341.1 peptidoglycan-binding protein [Streptomyces sp. CWNU-1]